MKLKNRFLTLFLLFVCSLSSFSQGILIPTDDSQDDFLNTYYFVLSASNDDYHSTNTTFNNSLFPSYGEYSVYWASSGDNKGKFVYPDQLSDEFASVTYEDVGSYGWQSASHYAVQFKKHGKSIAIFKSSLTYNSSTVSWEALYFKAIFDSYLFDDICYYINDEELATGTVDSNTKLLIIPSFTEKGTNNSYFIEQVIEEYPGIVQNIKNFLANGGTVYAEGNAVYLLEKAGILESGTVDFTNQYDSDPSTGLIDVTSGSSVNPVAFTLSATGNTLYAESVPTISTGLIETIVALEDGNPVVFEISGKTALGGRIVCNTGLPAAGGMANIEAGSRQLQWALNAVFYAFSHEVDVTRSVYNEIPDGVSAGKNAISYDAVDTFKVIIKLRNLSENTIDAVSVTEQIREYFSFADVPDEDIDFTLSDKELIFGNISLPPLSEKEIVYRLKTPEPEDSIHSIVDDFITDETLIYVSKADVTYIDNGSNYAFTKKKNYADLMFSADIAADTDLNWKNFLGLDYQPFKVFMIMENKERTTAEQTVYSQYIPKDVPFYRVDHSLNIPVLKTPGGEYIDILKGSNDEDNPEYDMDNDGNPDVWLDTTSIYPKGYTITEEEVYWLNPWNYLREDDEDIYFEDIDHDGITARDTDGDAIVDVDEPGDKIRVWKVSWNIGEVPGLQAYDPYCSYEIWVDPPALVPLSAGVATAYDSLYDYDGDLFYPYTPDIENANLSDTTWTRWMEKDDDDNVVWKQLIFQEVDNYEGFTFIDTLDENYTLQPTDKCVGSAPQPHREFIAVLSLGGEEIDMNSVTPANSMYSKIEYNTIFDEEKVTPIRTTYTYYAPLPNPLQFEYLTNNYSIYDIQTGEQLQYLPNYGTVNISFEVDASTEYSYYWIRNVGHDVDYNDPSEATEGVESLGDGVFGYMIHDIPKGLGGYSITLPKNADGSYNIDSLVQVDGQPFQKWIDNENTGDSIEVWEDEFQYHVYIPQLLIPPALDDDNFDGTDDWIDDRGDRFMSETGFLHDSFMLDDGEDWSQYPATPFTDDIYGEVSSGWYGGSDNTYGDDFFEKPGKTHLTFNVIYEGSGREGPVDLSKGGWLVVEEIFGGSPWVIFSHTLSGYAQGLDITLTSSANPSLVNYGTDTTCIKHIVEDVSEPHEFDAAFDPYHVSYGYGDATFTTYCGGKDPCSLINPAISMSAIIDPAYRNCEITFLPDIDEAEAGEGQTLSGYSEYPKKMEGAFVEVRIEVMNGTGYDWKNTTITPMLTDETGATRTALSYVAYPRPLVPGDDIGAFVAGWRFNEPEDEVLVKLGNELPVIHASRRAYFIFLFQIDETLENGIYTVDFKISGTKESYDGTSAGEVSYEIPAAKFSIAPRDENGNIEEYEKLVVGQGSLENIEVFQKEQFSSLNDARWSVQSINHTDFEELSNKLPVSSNKNNNLEIDLSLFQAYPTVDTNKIYILQRGEVSSLYSEDEIVIADSSVLNFNYENSQIDTASSTVKVSSIGPKIEVEKAIVKIHGEAYESPDTVTYFPEGALWVEVLLTVTNNGSDIAQNTTLSAYIGSYFTPFIDSLPDNSSYSDGIIETIVGTCSPGSSKELSYYASISTDDIQLKTLSSDTLDLLTVIYQVDILYKGTAVEHTFSFVDEENLEYNAFDLNLTAFTSDKEEICRGSKINFTTSVENRALPAGNIDLGLYAISDSDTTLVHHEQIETLDRASDTDISFDYTVQDSIQNIKFMAMVDTDDEFPEITEENNQMVLKIPFLAPNLTLTKSVVDINGTQVSENNQWLLNPLDELEITVQIEISNTGTDNAKDAVIYLYLDDNLQPVSETLPDNCTFSNYVIEIDIDELEVGETMTIQLILTEIEFSRKSINQLLTIITNHEILYKEKTSSLQFKLENNNPLEEQLLFDEIYDFAITGFESDLTEVKRGSVITLSSGCQNLSLYGENVIYRMYAIQLSDTTILAESTLSPFTNSDTPELTVDYTIPDDAVFARFFVRIDDSEIYPEQSEEDNTGVVEIPLSGIYPINDAMNYPNPFSSQTWFSYSISRKLTDVSITIYSTTRGLIAEISDCPGTIGKNTVSWIPPNLSAGAYYYVIEGKDINDSYYSAKNKLIIGHSLK